MTSSWNKDSLVPPITVKDIIDNGSMEDGLTFKDFLPQCSSSSGKSTYETFGLVVGRANEWLKANPQWEIKTCESVVFTEVGSSINYERMAYIDTQNWLSFHVRGLRLWILNSESKRKVGQQIDYFDLMPQEIRKKGLLTPPVYESLDAMIIRFNAMIRKEPLKGRIITIQTQKMWLRSPKETNPDISSWTDIGAASYIFYIRIFFEIAVAHNEEIGIEDFVPDILESRSTWKDPKLELFPSIMNKISQWRFRQTDIRICNIQTIDIQITKDNEINTKKMHFKQGTYFARIIRVAFMKSDMKKEMESNITTQLTCKTFEPVLLKFGVKFKAKHFETLTETKARMSAWIKATGAQVVSVESTVRWTYVGYEKPNSHEESLTVHIGGGKQVWIHLVRVYMNGIYPEPPTEKLPLVPKVEDLTCPIQ